MIIITGYLLINTERPVKDAVEEVHTDLDTAKAQKEYFEQDTGDYYIIKETTITIDDDAVGKMIVQMLKNHADMSQFLRDAS